MTTVTDVLSLSLQASQCFSFVLLTFIWSNFLLFLLAFRFREIAVFPHALIRNVLLCVFKRISWPRKSGCLKMPSPPCCLLTKGNEHLEHYIFSLLSWMGRGSVGRNRCCKPEYTAPDPWGFPAMCGDYHWPAEPVPPCLNPIQGNTGLKVLVYQYFRWLINQLSSAIFWWLMKVQERTGMVVSLESLTYCWSTLEPLFTAAIRLIIYKV